jgi:hypothetical protein
LSKLTDEQRSSLLAHELAHLKLWRQDDHELLITEQILSALTNDPHAHVAHVESARLFRLYSEIYCDRIAAHVVGDPLIVISMLVRMLAGVEDVDAKAYLAQSDEVLAKTAGTSEGATHPETYVRAKALQLWFEQPDQADIEVRRLLQGSPTLDGLDLLGQLDIQGKTKRLLHCFLRPSWLRTDSMLATAKLFFDDLRLPPTDDSPTDVAVVAEEMKSDHSTVLDYYCFVLLDLVTADAELDEAPLARALELAESLGFKDRLIELVACELRLRKKQLQQIDEAKRKLQSDAKEEFQKQAEHA